MIKRENIKQAIDAISARDAEIGYSLNEMLGMGQIDVPSATNKTSERDEYYFLFDKEKVFINKFLYFNEGIVPIEQGLLIKYGEMIKKQDLLNRRDPIDYMQAAREIKETGLKLLVTHEIDYAIARIRKRLGRPEIDSNLPADKHLISFMEKIKQDTKSREIHRADEDPTVLYRGIVDDDTPAHFMCFPFSMDSLMQVADMNLEFFHVRFLLNCLIRGLGRNLFICSVDHRILGLVYLTLKERMFAKDLEIKFIATLRGKTGNELEQSHQPPKGVGAFLVAGVWMLWKTTNVKITEISLDSETGSRRFYEAIGFQPRGLSEYVLKEPKGYLLKAIFIMANNCQSLGSLLIEELEGYIKKQVKSLRKKVKSEEQSSDRKVIIAAVRECLKSEAHPAFAKTAMSTLIKYQGKIPEYKELFRFASECGSDETKAHIKNATIIDR